MAYRMCVSIYSTLCCLVLQFLTFSISAQTTQNLKVPVSSLPVWKQVFVNSTSWYGKYLFDGREITCSLQVLNVMREEGGIVYAEFRDPDTELQFEARSSDNLTIIMRKSHLYKSTSERITLNEDFEISGNITRTTFHSGWKFQVIVTKPQTKQRNFTNFKFYNYANGNEVKSTDSDGSTSSRIGLLIGMVVLCVILGIAVLGGMLVYAIRKGIFRHVPFSYDNFKNSNDAASFNSKQETVHI